MRKLTPAQRRTLRSDLRHERRGLPLNARSSALRAKLARRGYYWRGWLHFRTGAVYGWHLTPKALTALGINWEAGQKADKPVSVDTKATD